jgi:hypothetical protein
MKKIRSIRTRAPVGIWLISIFYMFGAIALLIGLYSIPVGLSRSIASVHGLPTAVDGFIVPLVIGLAFLISFGLFARTWWGYFLTATYLLFFGIESLLLMRPGIQQPYLGNAIWCMLVLLYLAWKWKYFFARREDPLSPAATTANAS